MGWVLSMAVVEGLSAEEVAGRLELELGEETIGDSSGKEATAGPGPPAVGIHRVGQAVVLDEPYDDAPVLEDARLVARLSRATRVVLFQLSERVNCGFFQVGCWVHGAVAWQITHCREEAETEEYQVLGVPSGRPPAIWERRWWRCLSPSPASTMTGMVGGGTSGIGISGPSIEPQPEVT